MEFIVNSATMFTIPQGLLLALVGFGIVLLVLIVLMGFIYLMSYVVNKLEFSKKGEKSSEKTAEAPVALAPGSSGDIKLHNVDERTAAMLMAIIADELKTPLNELRFISIKEVTEEGK